MTSVIIMSFMVSMGLFLPLMSQPLSLGLVVMMLAFFNCLAMSLFQSSWYSYILFLIFVGGLLVMFAYVAALCPNLLFKQSMLVAGLPLVLSVLSYAFYKLYWVDISFLGDNSCMSFKWMSAFGLELGSPSVISILVGLGVILLVNLIAVVKICFFQQGSLRPFLK